MTRRRKIMNSICAKMNEMSNESLSALDSFADTLIKCDQITEPVTDSGFAPLGLTGDLDKDLELFGGGNNG